MKRLLQRYTSYIEQRELTRVQVEFHFSDGPITYIRRQLASIGFVALGLLLAIPSVPGPGLALVAFSLFIGSYPGKKRFINWIRDKKYFRYARILLRKKLKVLLIMPKPISNDDEETSDENIVVDREMGDRETDNRETDDKEIEELEK